MAYEESVRSSRWFVWLVELGALAALAGGLLLLRDEGSRGNGGVIGGVVLIAVGILLAVVAWTFRTLRIRVDREALRVRFGPFGSTCAATRSPRPAWSPIVGWRTVDGAYGSAARVDE